MNYKLEKKIVVFYFLDAFTLITFLFLFYRFFSKSGVKIQLGNMVYGQTRCFKRTKYVKFCEKRTPILRFVLLPYYQRFMCFVQFAC